MEGAARTLHPRRDIDVPDPAKMLIILNVWCKKKVPVLVDFMQLPKAVEDVCEVAGIDVEILNVHVLSEVWVWLDPGWDPDGGDAQAPADRLPRGGGGG